MVVRIEATKANREGLSANTFDLQEAIFQELEITSPEKGSEGIANGHEKRRHNNTFRSCRYSSSHPG